MLTVDESWTCYASIYSPKVFYPCKLTSFRVSEWKSVTQKSTAAFLSKMNFNRNTHRQVVFGPRLYGGIAHHHGFARQGAESTVHLLTHLRWNNELGSLMRCVLSQFQLFSGRGRPVLEYPEPQPTRKPKKGLHIYHWHHLGNGWLPSIRNYLAVIGGKLLLKMCGIPDLCGNMISF